MFASASIFLYLTSADCRGNRAARLVKHFPASQLVQIGRLYPSSLTYIRYIFAYALMHSSEALASGHSARHRGLYDSLLVTTLDDALKNTVRLMAVLLLTIYVLRLPNPCSLLVTALPVHVKHAIFDTFKVLSRPPGHGWMLDVLFMAYS
ncbi:hypothetical protein F4777DRAFT_197430 [Nemania sp. FL0916]|nr:hypothetical protein F4777DRAFT_197430 [Nemania sp. FL0916]